ncbi:MAG: hypothetical protein MI807_08810 [Verrucomicrobiales bacterium]|nr:hypothetical protein [Verrucomicrobiales bacterium]
MFFLSPVFSAITAILSVLLMPGLAVYSAEYILDGFDPELDETVFVFA